MWLIWVSKVVSGSCLGNLERKRSTEAPWPETARKEPFSVKWISKMTIFDKESL